MILDPRLLVVLAQIFLFADQRGLDVTITSIHSGREHLRSISKTHEEYRALDIRSKNWPEKYKLELVKRLNKTMGHHGAIGLLTGERRVIIYEKNARGGEHFHIQVSKLVNDMECFDGESRKRRTKKFGSRVQLSSRGGTTAGPVPSKLGAFIGEGLAFCTSSSGQSGIYQGN